MGGKLFDDAGCAKSSLHNRSACAGPWRGRLWLGGYRSLSRQSLRLGPGPETPPFTQGRLRYPSLRFCTGKAAEPGVEGEAFRQLPGIPGRYPARRKGRFLWRPDTVSCRPGQRNGVGMYGLRYCSHARKQTAGRGYLTTLSGLAGLGHLSQRERQGLGGCRGPWHLTEGGFPPIIKTERALQQAVSPGKLDLQS